MWFVLVLALAASLEGKGADRILRVESGIAHSPLGVLTGNLRSFPHRSSSYAPAGKSADIRRRRDLDIGM